MHLSSKVRPSEKSWTKSQQYQIIVLQTIENMVEVIKMEDMDNSKEKMLPGLKKMVDSVSSTMKLETRMSPQMSNQTLINLQQTVLEFLAISGIEALLPLDCGKVSGISLVLNLPRESKWDSFWATTLVYLHSP